MKRTNGQNKRLYALLSKLCLDAEIKADLAKQVSAGRTEKTSELDYHECNHLITLLNDQILGQNQRPEGRHVNSIENDMRRTIYKLMYECGFMFNTDHKERKAAIIDGWIRKKMNLTISLNELNIDQLQKMITQLQAVKRIYNSKKQDLTKLN